MTATTSFPGFYFNPLECLVIGDPFRPTVLGEEPDWAEMMDAAWEDAEGRLPHEAGYGGAPVEPAVAGPAQLELVQVPRVELPRRPRARRRRSCPLEHPMLWADGP